jgi:nitrate/TMAO reductase-like tetraheme cytochrome c subunit
MGKLLILCLLVAQAAMSQTSPHGKLTIACEACHSTDSWRMRPDASFDHDKLRFPLTGQHKALGCASCHANLRFEATQTACVTCHTDIHRSELGPECARCHTTQSWLVPDMIQKHQETQFPLLGRHQAVDCQSCHTGLAEQRFAGAPITCAGCHLQDYQTAQSPNHLAAGFSTNCEDCHSASAFTWSQGFDHSVTAFPLTGAHLAVECISCHRDQVFAGTPLACVACHQADFSGAQDPNHAAAGFSTECQDCHSTASWDGATFDHNQTGFVLTGSHRTASCKDCHGDNVFAGKPVDCYSCHGDDFLNAQNPNHSQTGFSTDCQSCHTTTGWKPASFDHSATAFPLTGAHVGEDCQSCHEGGNYQLVYVDCYQCHQDDFTSVEDPNHVTGNFSHDCTPCHNTTSWEPASFDHNATGFPLTGAHISTDCQSCHTNGNYQITYTDCYQCHQSEYQSVSDPNHVTGNFSHDCTTCHNTTSWGTALFDHNATAFPLTGSHVTTECQACHTGGNYQIVYTDCYQCHQTDFTAAIDPNHVLGNFSHDCQPCHTTTSWLPSTFNHGATALPLTGAHVTAQCQSCHVGGNYQITYTDCYQCHQTDFTAVLDPNHVLGNFSHDCQSCHTTTAWLPSTFNHGATAFPLTGAHVTAQCQSCHLNGNYQITYTDCYQCHASDFSGVVDPSHVLGNFSHDCQPCHTTTAWVPSTFSHNTTAFPLTGAHVTTECQSCHVGGNYQITYTDCYQCHQGEFTGVTDPNHVLGNFSHDCQPCHSTTAWLPATLDHNATGFPLTGAHVTTTCEACHVNGNYQLTYTDCYQCHASDFGGVIDPNHVLGNFSHDCQPCHTTTAWLPSTFNHSTTAFPLTGAHVSAQCQSCHVGGNYQLTYTDCYQCHESDFTGVVEPSHVLGNFSHDCTPCHTTTAWLPATFDHGTTNFPLTGAHVATPCQSCHVNGNYQLTYTDCYECHVSDFQVPQEPNHVAGNFDHDCTPCHTTTAWMPSTFSHDNTPFPLTGAHQAVACSDCHINNQYQGTPTVCYDCHLSDYNNAVNPNHVAGGFPTDCMECHTTTGWSPATFDHNLTDFPLTGAHLSTDCQSCHVGGNYQLEYTDCYECHESDYQVPTDPNHVLLQFSHDCTPCHTTTAWLPSTFDHDAQYFRIYSGAHQGKWSSCAECHPSVGNYAEFTCISCHEHNQPDMDDEHQGVPGYVYSSPACYDCHRGVLLQ